MPGCATPAILLPESLASAALAPCLLVGRTPPFPATAMPTADAHDRRFEQRCRRVFGDAEHVVRHPRSLTSTPSHAGAGLADQRSGGADDDGAIGFCLSLGAERATLLDLAKVWVALREVLAAAATWPRTVQGYGGPLLCRVALGNITGLSVAPDAQAVPGPSPASGRVRNTLPGWHEQREWTTDEAVDDLIDDLLASLARQLPCRWYGTIRPNVRARATH